MAYEMTIKERLRKYVSFISIPKNEFEMRIKSSGGFLSNNSEPNGKLLISILDKYPDLSAEWLMRGEGEMIRKIISSSTPSMPETASEPVDGYGWSTNHPQGSDKLLQERIYFLEKLLQEKERTIKILMDKK